MCGMKSGELRTIKLWSEAAAVTDAAADVAGECDVMLVRCRKI